jgi:hypothetical protein
LNRAGLRIRIGAVVLLALSAYAAAQKRMVLIDEDSSGGSNQMAMWDSVARQLREAGLKFHKRESSGLRPRRHHEKSSCRDVY